MTALKLFTDGSVHPQSEIGIGAWLLTTEMSAIPDDVQLVRFEQTSSTRLELQTLIHALQHIQPQNRPVIIYSDSQNIIGLTDRRQRLEKQNFCSKDGTPLNNADLYRTFFQLTEEMVCTFKKVKGHKRSRQKSEIDRIFTLVDRASRQALRKELSA